MYDDYALSCDSFRSDTALKLADVAGVIRNLFAALARRRAIGYVFAGLGRKVGAA